MIAARLLMVASLALGPAAWLSTAWAGPPPGGEKSGTIVAKQGQAKTLRELIAMYDSTSCKECHEDIHRDWMESPHARSVFGTGRTAATFQTAITNGLMTWPFSGVHGPGDVKVEHFQGCTKCHLPQLADATDAVAKELATTLFAWREAVNKGDAAARSKHEATLGQLGITCLVCHNRNAIVHKWTDGYPQAGVVYGSESGEHAADDYPLAAKSPIMHEAIACGQCHGLGPNLELDNPTQCATLYGSYLWSYVADGGDKTCQQCHMSASGLGHKILSYRDPKMAEMALDFEVTARAVNWRDGTRYAPRAVVAVAMTNRAGHGIPDG
ncbi:MAG: cytochrome C [Deltaproteobacteria bacterium HGW-Deltaproteobacteria-14]|jgi:hypothetical protein|nr:MAG: cytochrome C [Deltaproteobacteria bacterium HGW-Deltaproteobacteria-14]